MNFDSFILCASTSDLSEVQSSELPADAIEFRMDLTSDPLEQLEMYSEDLPILATNRSATEGGHADEVGRLKTLRKASEYDHVSAIDIELDTVESGQAETLLEGARHNDCAIVASTHWFDSTPTIPEMTRTLERATAVADVGKIAITPQSLEDTLALLSVTRNLTEAGEDVATMAMGAIGSHTRAIAPIYGSKIGYAPIDSASATAPGQFDLETLSALVDTLEVERA